MFHIYLRIFECFFLNLTNKIHLFLRTNFHTITFFVSLQKSQNIKIYQCQLCQHTHSRNKFLHFVVSGFPTNSPRLSQRAGKQMTNGRRTSVVGEARTRPMTTALQSRGVLDITLKLMDWNHENPTSGIRIIYCSITTNKVPGVTEVSSISNKVNKLFRLVIYKHKILASMNIILSTLSFIKQECRF